MLIDEYNALIVHYLEKDIEMAHRNRDELREFYTALKNNDHLLELVFITGVSKFAKAGVFSGLNNLRDITMHPQYAIMLGYTRAELEANFEEEVAQTTDYLPLTREQLPEQLRLWYTATALKNAPKRSTTQFLSTTSSISGNSRTTGFPLAHRRF